MLQRSPTDKPPFTLAQIKKAIPPHCLERSVLKSSSYLLQDLLIVAALLYAAVVCIPTLPGALRLAAWPLYWVAQGCVTTGVWVIAHECGHHAFSDHALLDDAVGLLLHSCLLVPYFSWKHSHRRHHANTASMDRDEVFVPNRKHALAWFTRYVHGTPAGRVAHILVLLTLGWPAYLAVNAAGRPYPRFACHFDPYSPIYSHRERAQILVSDAGVLATSFALFRLAAAFGLWRVVRVYAAPLLVVNAWLVLVTYLQHTHPALPRYDAAEWDWLRGALATVDRDFGVLNRVFHNITDTHVAHHLFPTMPHYHAVEATMAIKPVLGEYYRFDATPIAKATWREVEECVYVHPQPDRRKGVLWYSNNF